MKKNGVTLKKWAVLIILLVPARSFCCVNCNPQLQSAIKASWQENGMAIVSPFMALLLITGFLCWLALRKNRKLLSPAAVPLLCASMVLGMD